MALMRQVYENAEEVVVFLGNGLRHRILKSDLSQPPVLSGSLRLEDGQVLADLLSRCSSSRGQKALDSEAVLNVDAILRLLSNPLTTDQLVDGLMTLDEPIRRQLFEHLRNFLISPWWERIWVVQEITVNRKVTIRYGAMSAPWDLLELAATVLSELRLEPSRAQAKLESENWKVLLLLESQVAGIRRIRKAWDAKGVTTRDYLLHEMLLSDDQGVRAANIRRLKVIRESEAVARLDPLLQEILESNDMVTRAASILQLRKNWSYMLHGSLRQALSSGNQRTQATNIRRRLITLETTSEAVNLTNLLNEILESNRLEIQTANIRQVCEKWQAEAAKNLNQLLQEFSNRRASDDRDKLFGLLSLASPGHGVIPDYTLDVNETFRNTVLCLIKASGSLDVWSGDQRRKNNKDLPSWVPDWSATFSPSDSQRLETLDFYDASGDWKLVIITREEDFWISIRSSLQQLRDSLKRIKARLPESLTNPIRNCCGRLKAEASDASTEELHDLILGVVHELDQLLVRRETALRDGRFRPTSEVDCSQLFNRTHGGPVDPKVPSIRRSLYLDRAPLRQTILSSNLGKTGFMIEASRVDRVARVGSPLWSWTDLEAGLRTLLTWFHLYNDSALATAPGHVASMDQNPLAASGSPVSKSTLDELIEFVRTIVAGGLTHRIDDATTSRYDLDFGSHNVLNDEDLKSLAEWLHTLLQQTDEVIGRVKRGQRKLENLDHIDTLNSHLIPFQQSVQHATEGRVFFTTETGCTGLGPASMEPGDTISMLPSGKTHFILRPANSKNAEEKTEFVRHGIQVMELIGDCYWSKWAKKNQRGPEIGQPQLEGSLPFELLAPFFGIYDSSWQRIVLI